MPRIVLIVLLAGTTLFAGEKNAEKETPKEVSGKDSVRVESVHIRLIDQVEVPAQSEGLLSQIVVKEGQLVAADDVLVHLDDTDSRLAVEGAQIDLDIAQRLADSDLKTQLARKAATEAQEAKGRAELELEIARRKAENDVHVRYARKAAEVAITEHQRAVQARKAFRDSVSQSEVDTLRLNVEKTALEVEQSEHDLAIAKVTRQVKQSEISSLSVAIEKRELELKQSEEDRQIAGLTRNAKASDLAIAQREFDRRTIKSPLAGVVVQIHKRRGEWVKPEDRVLRILRLDRLRAEGFVSYRDLRFHLEGADVTVKVSLPDNTAAEFRGRVVFVSPEIDAVNGQVRIWADVDNPEYLLRPGMKATMSIQTAGPPAAAASGRNEARKVAPDSKSP